MKDMLIQQFKIIITLKQILVKGLFPSTVLRVRSIIDLYNISFIIYGMKTTLK